MSFNNYLLALCAVSTAYTTRAMDKTLVKPEIPMSRSQQFSLYWRLQAERIEAERAEKKERKRLAREARQLSGPTQEEYMEIESTEYIELFVPFAKQHAAGKAGQVPAGLAPRTVFYVPHKKGLIQLRLHGSSTLHNQACLSSFLEILAKKFLAQSKRCKGVRHNIYKAPDVKALQNLLLAEIDTFIADRERLRTILHGMLKERGLEATEMHGAVSLPFSCFASNADFTAMLSIFTRLQDNPAISKADAQALRQLATTAKIVPINGRRYYCASNFQGVI